MVLSLGFILAFIGAAISLVVGILIFSEISDAIICPAGSGGGGGGGFLFDTLDEAWDSSQPIGISSGVPPYGPTWVGQVLPTNGEQISSVTVEGMDNGAGSSGTLKVQIYEDATTNIASSTLIATSSNTFGSIPVSSNVNFTWVFTPSVTVNDPNTFIALLFEGYDANIYLKATTSGFVGDGDLLEAPNATEAFNGGTAEDILMQVALAGGSPAQQGNLECESAKDTAWTVIGILPVALFFALFAIFGALGRPQG